MGLIEKVFEIIVAVILLSIFIPVIIQIIEESGMNPLFSIIAIILIFIGLIAALIKALGF